MPELPEVENYRLFIESTSMRQKVVDVLVHDQKVLSIKPEKLKSFALGQYFVKTERLGKNLIIILDSGKCIIMHFGMTGFPEVLNENEDLPKHSRVNFKFETGKILSFNCRRKFGRVDVDESIEHFQKRKKLGQDALKMSWDDFYAIAQKKKSSDLKSFLLNQSILSGVGNWVADEIAYQTKNHPAVPMEELDKPALKNLFQKMHKIMNTAIAEKADYKRYPKNFFFHYRKEGLPCPDCDGEVEKITVAGRSTYYCPSCQKLPAT